MPVVVPTYNQDGSIDAFIRIDFEKHSPDPGRIFRAASELIDSLFLIDVDLAKSVDLSIRPAILLEDVEAGSIRIWIRTFLEQIDDDALKSLDWKPLVGQYLVKAKHAFLRVVDEHDTIDDREVIEELRGRIAALNPAEDVAVVPTRETPPTARLLDTLNRLGLSLSNLRASDKVFYASPEGEVALNQSFRITSDQIEALLTQEVVSAEVTVVLKIKKPDYLGLSMWEFRYDDRIIEAKVLDSEWLDSFQAGRIELRPGDSVRARLCSEIRLDSHGQVVASKYSVTRVFEIIRGSPGGEQLTLPPPPGEAE